MVSLPNEFAARFGSDAERDRHVLEVLGFGTRGELDGFFKERGIDDGMTVERALRGDICPAA